MSHANLTNIDKDYVRLTTTMRKIKQIDKNLSLTFVDVKSGELSP